MCKQGGILYAQEGKKTKDWANIPERSQAAYLREQYWLNRVRDRISPRKDFMSAGFYWDIPRSQLDRKHDDPADGFFLQVVDWAYRSPERDGMD